MLIRACDIDKKTPATTYTITAGDGRSISKDLCEEHAEPFEEWLEEAEPGEEPEPEPAPEPARKATARKATAKKAPARRRPKVTSLEEIEAKKK
ncbi:hypothetical protein [Streptomyces sp. BBFR102]|uniref:hypothetical protein n=1 Tax=Streptomyces sp. BBFR102 TaxID=3448171 RepID=UPI003F52A8F0